jgi:hypothetical protein
MCDARWRWLAAIAAVVVGAAACHTAPVDTRPPLDSRLGVFRFTEHVTAGGGSGDESVDIEGQLVVFGDTVSVEARPGPCRMDTRIIYPNPITYDCGGVTLSFDRRDPVGRAQYSVSLGTTQKRQVCAAYAIDNAGRRYCSQYRTETTAATVKRSGYLRLTRAP